MLEALRFVPHHPRALTPFISPRKTTSVCARRGRHAADGAAAVSRWFPPPAEARSSPRPRSSLPGSAAAARGGGGGSVGAVAASGAAAAAAGAAAGAGGADAYARLLPELEALERLLFGAAGGGAAGGGAAGGGGAKERLVAGLQR